MSAVNGEFVLIALVLRLAIGGEAAIGDWLHMEAVVACFIRVQQVLPGAIEARTGAGAGILDGIDLVPEQGQGEE